MSEKKLRVNGVTVRELKEFLNSVPDDTEIYVDNIGDTGYVERVHFTIITFDMVGPELFLDIKAESGFHY